MLERAFVVLGGLSLLSLDAPYMATLAVRLSSTVS